MKVLSVLLFFLFNGFLGLGNISEGLVKEYLYSKVPILKKFKIKEVKYSFNNFSVILINGNNKITLVGHFYPFDATYTAKLNALNQISQLRGKMFTQGEINEDGNIKGNVVLAKGYGEYSGKIKKVKYFLNDMDLKSFLFTLGINFTTVDGKINTKGEIKKSSIIGEFNSKGIINAVDKIKFESFGDFVYKNFNHYNVRMKFDSDLGRGESDIIKEEYLYIKGKMDKVNLKAIKNFTLYPFNVVYKFNFKYNSFDGIFNFNSENVNGYFDKKLFLQLKEQSAEKFFELIGKTPFLKGKVSGDIIIDKKGIFNILIDQASFLPTKITKYIFKTSGVNLQNLQKMFFKGEFDRNSLIFNLLSKNKKFTLNIHKARYSYDGKYEIKIELTTTEKKFFYLLKNGKIKLIKVKNLAIKAPETLVF